VPALKVQHNKELRSTKKLEEAGYTPCQFVGAAPFKDAADSNPTTSHSKGSAEDVAEAGQDTEALDTNAETSHSKDSPEESVEAGLVLSLV
jgi:hypothetical protein